MHVEDILILQCYRKAYNMGNKCGCLFKLTLLNACGINKYKEYFECTDKTKYIIQGLLKI